MKLILSCVFITLFISITFFHPLDAYAYIDLGSGTILIQMLFAGLLGLLFTLKTYFKKIREIIINIIRKSNKKIIK